MTAPRISTKAIWEGSISVVEVSTGSAIDTSGATALSLVVQDPQTNEEVMTGALGTEVTAVDASSGLYNFKFGTAKTKKLKPKTYWFAGLITDSEGDVRQLFRTRITAYDGIVG